MANARYYSVQDFIKDVAHTYSAVYLSHTGKHMLVARAVGPKEGDRVVVVELSPTQTYYTVVTGWIQSNRKPVKGTLAWERRD